jgi:hypothetical protein
MGYGGTILIPRSPHGDGAILALGNSLNILAIHIFITLWSRFLLEDLVAVSLIKKFPSFYETR